MINFVFGRAVVKYVEGSPRGHRGRSDDFSSAIGGASSASFEIGIWRWLAFLLLWSLLGQGGSLSPVFPDLYYSVFGLVLNLAEDRWNGGVACSAVVVQDNDRVGRCYQAGAGVKAAASLG